jgi:hypothetical protein
MLDRLLGKGMFPKELPPPFTSASFASFATENGALDFIPARTRRSPGYISSPCNYNLARPGNFRRSLHIPNPFNYYQLCKRIADGWPDIEAHFNTATLSVSRPRPDPDEIRAFRRRLDGSELPTVRAANRAGKRAILRTDISRFYHSIYSHSVPWALMGKAAAKATRSGGLANDLDLFVRNSQDGQTMGIPVGPDSSLVLSEIIGAALDARLQANGLTGYRYVDDFEFVFESRAAAEAALPRIELVLREYELEINPTKTAVEDLPQPSDRRWVSTLRAFHFGASVTTPNLLAFFDRAFELRSEYPDEAVLAYAISRLRSESISASTWVLFQDLLLQCVVVEPGSLASVVALLHAERDRGIGLKVGKVLSEVVAYHAPFGHSSEVAWALWAALWFEIELDPDVVGQLGAMTDNVSVLLALHAQEKGLLPAGSSPQWEALMTSSSLVDGNWLLSYEADIKGWLPSADSKNHVEEDPLFGRLKEARVSFYDTEMSLPTTSYLVFDDYGELSSDDPPDFEFPELEDDFELPERNNGEESPF